MPAIPYTGEEFIYLSPDGSKIRVRGWGDRFCPIFETLDGYTVVKDPKSGYLHYATVSPDKTALLPSGLRVGEIPAQYLSIPKHLRVNHNEIFLPLLPSEEEICQPPRR